VTGDKFGRDGEVVRGKGKEGEGRSGWMGSGMWTTAGEEWVAWEVRSTVHSCRDRKNRGDHETAQQWEGRGEGGIGRDAGGPGTLQE
jgi:hypothetical protein